MILETLKVDDRTCQGAHAILGVALLSRWHFDLVGAWALSSIKKPPFATKYRHIELEPSRARSIAMLCKHFGWICASCNNKARTSHEADEEGSRARFCHVCETEVLYEYWIKSPERYAKVFESYLISEACSNGGMDPSARKTCSPHIIDLLLLSEFRYRFDPTWRPEDSQKRKLEEYVRFATPWADSEKWNDRPWAMQNFPNAPWCAFLLKTLELRKGEACYQAYQSTCTKIRALLKAFPQILRAPEVWRRCTIVSHRHSTLAEDVKIALKGKEEWRESPQKDCKFQIQKRDGEYDVEFVGRGFNLEYGNCQNGTRKQPFGNWWADIIGVRKGQVFTQSWRVVA